MLSMFQKVMFGPLKDTTVLEYKDLKLNELAVLIPISLLIFIMGVYPQHF
jgi:NADH-quinone oxidoreductase subunit M